MTFDPKRFYCIDEDRRPDIGKRGFVADDYRTLRTMVEVENMNCYGTLTSRPFKSYPYGFEIDHDGTFWNCFYEVDLL